ncbi:glycosyltransferase family 2 protein [Winogradskyella wichelsiae]|uniref:glycosyltransferase family 2 protein n=1 Tax=Winogradskyella wichelsiae TaxID=2697007 RepID=UPI003EF263A0
MSWPKISVITPVFNQVEYIEETIQSVINQGYPNLEYIIIDGGSTDGTLDIIKKYNNEIAVWKSEKDSGMYDALNKGFKISTGTIMCWINSDDLLLPNSLFNMTRLFNDLPEVNWIQGLNSFIDLKGSVVNVALAKKFSFIKFLNNDFKWIQQESTFWRRSLWEATGGYIDESLKYAGDFELWFRFAKYDKLCRSTLSIGGWRKRDNQLSQKFVDAYLLEISNIIAGYEQTSLEKLQLKKIKKINYFINILLKTKIIKASYFINLREEMYDLDGTNIQYSYALNKFTVS